MKGQVSIEALTVVGLIIVLFFFCLMVYFDRSDQGIGFREGLGRISKCREISGLVSAAYSAGPGFSTVRAVRFTENTTLYSEGLIEMGGSRNTFYCNTLPIINNTVKISAGVRTLRFSNINGVVLIQ